MLAALLGVGPASAGYSRALVEVSMPAWSADGSQVAWTQQRAGWRRPGIVVARANGRERRLVVPEAAAPHWSPDGRHLAYLGVDPLAVGLLWIADADGTNPKLVATTASAAAWSADGRELYFDERGVTCEQLTAVDADNPAVSRVVTHGSDPMISPDGTKLAYLTSPNPPNCSGGFGLLTVADTDGSDARVVSSTPVYHASWAPDGHALAADVVYGFQGSQIEMIAADGSSQRPIAFGNNAAWSPDGTMIGFMTAGQGRQFPNNRPQLALYDVATGVLRTNLLSGADVYRGGPVWSPDSRQIALARALERGDDGVSVSNRFVTAQVAVMVVPVERPRSAHRISVAPCEFVAPLCTLAGGPTGDRLRGTSRRDVVWGYGGPDQIVGGRGSDELHGGSGDDVLNPGPGSDFVAAGADDDIVLARDGERDSVYCGSGYDIVIADAVDVVDWSCDRILRP